MGTEVSQKSLSKIKKVALRKVWPQEASDFTPWLEEHLGELGEALGIELEASERESRVGSRSLDIMATDSNGRPVIIENQLERSDDDHLGRLLIYAAGKDANVIIWIARDFEDEHWQVLQWLNQRTGTDTQFFGVAIEVWRIDDSRPAPYFKVVVAPNDWRKRNVSRKPRYREFRQRLEEKLKLSPIFHSYRAATITNPGWPFTTLTDSTTRSTFATGSISRSNLTPAVPRAWNGAGPPSTGLRKTGTASKIN
ncbi:MAG: hypothetical protein F4211_06235 [Acidimicrobiia bacterium]|nr:hypothetical protein [Acidimicrobiia bacterium]